MKSAVFAFQYAPATAQPVPQPVLTQQLKQELDQLLASFRKQVRNVVAVGNWLARNEQLRNTGQVPALPASPPEELSFPLKASPAAFALFTQTLLRTNAYLQENARIDAQNQILKVRVDFKNLAAWEYELSVIFEHITPALYVNTLLYDRPLQVSQRIAS